MQGADKGAARLAIVLFNLGGPDKPAAVEPFLYNLFNDPAIIALPGLLRIPLARFIAWRRGPVARAIYARLGGGSPILSNTEAQARVLEAELADLGQVRCFIAMRCWHPLTEEAAAAVKAFAPTRIVLLPLYPQYSTTTTASSAGAWYQAAARAGIDAPTRLICCYPREPGFVAALAAGIETALARLPRGRPWRLLLSAHGLPKKVIARGDPYRWQVERSCAAIVEQLGIAGLDWQTCYQSRVGPLEWIGPATDAAIEEAGRAGLALIVAPVAFVSEHSETLVELDMDYAALAARAGVPAYIRVPTVSEADAFIAGLARMVRRAASGEGGVRSGDGESETRICPAECTRCAVAMESGDAGRLRASA